MLTNNINSSIEAFINPSLLPGTVTCSSTYITIDRASKDFIYPPSDTPNLLLNLLTTEPVTIIPAPDNATSRIVASSIYIRNSSTTLPTTVTIRYKITEPAAAFGIVTIELPEESTLCYEPETGFKIITKSGGLTLNKSYVGLGNVDNTSDLNKPVSTATAAALALKQNLLTQSALYNQPFTGIITWIGTTQPSGTSDHRITMYRLGNTISFLITLDYSVASAATTNFVITNLTQLPDPQMNSNFIAALDYITLLTGRLMTTGKTTGTANISPVIRRNATNTAYEITCAPVFTTGGFRFVVIQGTYVCVPA